MDQSGAAFRRIAARVESLEGAHTPSVFPAAPKADLNLSHWIHDLPRQRAQALAAYNGAPTAVSNLSGGSVQWVRDDVYEIEVQDTAKLHWVPAQHTDFLTLTIFTSIPRDRVDDVLALSESVSYRSPNRLSARCHFMGANYATLALAMQVMRREVDPVEARRRYGPMIEATLDARMMVDPTSGERVVIGVANIQDYASALGFDFILFDGVPTQLGPVMRGSRNRLEPAERPNSPMPIDEGDDHREIEQTVTALHLNGLHSEAQVLKDAVEQLQMHLIAGIAVGKRRRTRKAIVRVRDRAQQTLDQVGTAQRTLENLNSKNKKLNMVVAETVVIFKNITPQLQKLIKDLNGQLDQI